MYVYIHKAIRKNMIIIYRTVDSRLRSEENEIIFNVNVKKNLSFVASKSHPFHGTLSLHLFFSFSFLFDSLPLSLPLYLSLSLYFESKLA